MSSIYKTNPLKDVFSVEPSAARRLARLIAIVYENFLSPTWKIFLRKGSITFQDPHTPNKVLKLTLDLNQKWSSIAGVSIKVDHPLVLGIEIESYNTSFEKNQMRDWLKKSFGDNFVDPRDTGNDTWCLAPIYNHHYDIVFLDSGMCQYPCDEEWAKQLQRKMENEIERLGNEDSGVVLNARG